MEVARWHFDGIYDSAKRLVGGAAYCEDCRARARTFSVMTGIKIKDGACYFKKDEGPEGCVNPCLPLTAGNVDAWRLFQLSFTCLSYRGMDGVPAGHLMEGVEAMARALRIRWDETLVTKFLLLQSSWLRSWHAKSERNREAAKKK